MTSRLPEPNEPVTSRSELLSLLTQACELEHGLACSYLYAAFSLKQDLSEGVLTSAQLQKVRLWAAQLYFVAAEEMLHLAQVWNLQAAIGGTPYYLRPNFPLPTNYYPLNLPIILERFSLSALDRFIQYERPADVPLVPEAPLLGPAEKGFNTVGELYGLIASGFNAIPESQLFIGIPGRQVGAELVDFPNIVKVESRASALAAIGTITEQGEGVQTDREDCHFGMFREVRRSYLTELAFAENTKQPFSPVRPSISNPTPTKLPTAGAWGANVISEPYTALVADTFDSIYGLMLRALQYIFDNATHDPRLLRNFSRLALELMTTVVKPLGEALMCLNAGSEYEGQTAGPGFVLVRHVPLPIEPRTAATIVSEKLDELERRIQDVAAASHAPVQLVSAARTFAELNARFRTSGEAAAGPLADNLQSGGSGPDGRAMPISTA